MLRFYLFRLHTCSKLLFFDNWLIKGPFEMGKLEQSTWATKKKKD